MATASTNRVKMSGIKMTQRQEEMLSKQTRKTSPNSMRKRAREEKANGSENTGWKQSKKFEKRVGINQLKAYVILFLFVSTHPVCSECVNV